MDTIFHGDLAAPGGRRRAWLDSLFVDHAVFRLLWGNAGAVIPGRLYRSNHPTPARLGAMARRYGLRTLINLRGRCANGSDALTRERAASLGITFIDAPVASRLPRRADVAALAAAFQGMAEPAVVHCKSGADRAGFAAALFLILNGRPVAEALRQMSWRFGHFRGARSGILDAFLLRFGAEGEGRMTFLDWLESVYDEETLAHEFAAHGLAHFVVDRVLRRE